MTEKYKCPNCFSEEFAAKAGNLLICLNCDSIYIKPVDTKTA